MSDPGTPTHQQGYRRHGVKLTDAERATAQTVFLKAFAREANLASAARRAKIDRCTVYEWRDNDPEFAAALASAQQDANDALCGEAHRRAVTGVLKPVFQNGNEVGSVREYSDGMLTLLLKARMPEFRQGSSTNVQVSGQIEHNHSFRAELESRLDRLATAVGTPPLLDEPE